MEAGGGESFGGKPHSAASRCCPQTKECGKGKEPGGQFLSHCLAVGPQGRLFPSALVSPSVALGRLILSFQDCREGIDNHKKHNDDDTHHIKSSVHLSEWGALILF